MSATPTSKPIVHAIVPRIPVGNVEQTRAFYERIDFACTHLEEGFMIVERDGAQLHLHPSNEPPTWHGAFWIRVSNIEALYQEYLAVNVIASSKVKAQPGVSKNFTSVIPFETSLFSRRVSPKKRGLLNKPGKQKDFSQDLVKHLIALLTSIIAQKVVLTAQGVGAGQAGRMLGTLNIDRLVPIVAGTERIPDRRISALKSRARISDVSRRRCLRAR